MATLTKLLVIYWASARKHRVTEVTEASVGNAVVTTDMVEVVAAGALVSSMGATSVIADWRSVLASTLIFLARKI